MIIQETSDKLVMRRYAGVREGKSLDKRIGAVPRDTSPNAIPTELLEDLTPKELRQLQARLSEIQKEGLRSKSSALVSEMNDIASALESGLLDTESVVDLHKAASVLAKRTRAVMPRVSSTSPESETS